MIKMLSAKGVSRLKLGWGELGKPGVPSQQTRLTETSTLLFLFGAFQLLLFVRLPSQAVLQTLHVEFLEADLLHID
jgi:hypothetical protein